MPRFRFGSRILWTADPFFSFRPAKLSPGQFFRLAMTPTGTSESEDELLLSGLLRPKTWRLPLRDLIVITRCCPRGVRADWHFSDRRVVCKPDGRTMRTGNATTRRSKSIRISSRRGPRSPGVLARPDNSNCPWRLPRHAALHDDYPDVLTTWPGCLDQMRRREEAHPHWRRFLNSPPAAPVGRRGAWPLDEGPFERRTKSSHDGDN